MKWWKSVLQAGRWSRSLWLGLALTAATTPAGATLAAQAPTRHVVPADDGHPLTVWEKHPARARGVILLLHGRTWPSLPDFDLQVPGHPVSLMDGLVARGYAVYALDARGYGGTPRDSSGWDTPDRAVADVVTVLRWIANGRSHGSGVRAQDAAGKGDGDPPPAGERPVLFGWSYGSVTAQLAAQRAPDAMSALVLFGHFTFPSPQPPDSSRGPAPRTATTVAAAGEDFITPAATEPAVRDAYIRAALQAQPTKPDWRSLDQWNALDPSAVHVPTLELIGERDPVSHREPGSEAAFFEHLGTPDRELVILPGVDHVALLENQRARFIEAIADFIQRPRTQAP